MILLSLGGQLLLNFIPLRIWFATSKKSIWRKIAVGVVGIELLAFLVLATYKVIIPDRGDFFRHRSVTICRLLCLCSLMADAIASGLLCDMAAEET